MWNQEILSKRCALFCNYRGNMWASYFENFCQQANWNIFSSLEPCLTKKKQYGHLQLITLCQSIPRVQMRFLARFMFIFKLGTAKTQQLASFLFHQSLAISEFLPPECYENDFLCWKSSQNYILSCCNLKKPVIVFCLSPQNPPLESYKCFASKIVKEFW